MTPRILYLSPFWPGEPSSASELRSLEVARALARCGRVTFGVVGVGDGNGPGQLRSLQEFDVECQVTIRPVRNRGIVQKLEWFLNPRTEAPHGLRAAKADAEAVFKLTSQFDLVWFFKLRTANMFPRLTWPRSVVDVDDVPSTFEQSVADAEPRPLARMLPKLRAWSWRRRERLLGERFAAVTVCSEPDAQHFRRLGVTVPIRVVPNGYEAPKVEPVRRLACPPRIGFIGVFDHEPNIAGVRWFVANCWPLIKRAIPDARLRLVGRLSDRPGAPTGPDIDGLGWLENPSEEMATWACMVVPVHTGAGSRGKIAHAFSQKCPVVSTALGAYGYEATDGHDMLLAESPNAFAAACIRVFREPQLGAAIAERAWQRYLTTWTWEAIAAQVRAAAEDGLRARS